MVLPKHTRHIKPVRLLALATLILTVTLSVAPHSANAATTNQYKTILGKETGMVLAREIPASLPLARETYWFWAHTFKLSKRFYPYTIYWNQRGIQGFNNTIYPDDTDVYYFVKDVLKDAETVSIGSALQLEGYEKKVNLILRYYTGRYTYADDHIYFGGDDTAVYIGDYDLKIDPTDQNKLAEKIMNFIKTNYPTIYDLLLRVSDGLESIETRDANINALDNATELEIRFTENITELGLSAIVRLRAILVDDNIVKISVLVLADVYKKGGAEWIRDFSNEVLDYVNMRILEKAKDAGVGVVPMNQSVRKNSINYNLWFYLNGTPIYLGVAGQLTAGIVLFDEVGDDGRGEFSIIFVDETPYLLKVLRQERRGFSITEDKALKVAGLEGKETELRKVWMLTSDGLTPAYIIRYSDEFGAHVKVVDASTGAVIYSSDGSLGTDSPAIGPYPGSCVWAMAGVAAAVGVGAAAVMLWRHWKH